MNIKTILRIIVILLAALALTALAASAQGEAPAALGESGSPAANLSESEPNNRYLTADGLTLGDAISGTIASSSDVDFYRIDMPPESANVLIDIDNNGSPLDAELCLYILWEDQLVEPHCNNDADGVNPLLFHTVYGPGGANTGGPFYIRVQAANNPAVGGSAYTYTLSVYRPILISAATDGIVAGIPFQKSDVLAHYDFADGTEKWLLFFDASDVGITRNVIGLGSIYGGSGIDVVLQNPQQIWTLWNGPEIVTPYDLLGFEPDYDAGDSYGPTTAGNFGIGYRGADYGLTKSSEKIDAISEAWVVSTIGSAIFASGQAVRDEDLSNLPYGELNFDGSQVPGLAAENVTAADEGSYGAPWVYYLTILGSGTVDGLKVTQRDIFTVSPSTHRVLGLVWHGPDHGFNYNIDAFDAVD